MGKESSKNMMTLVEQGKNFRIFKDNLLGIIPCYVIEQKRVYTKYYFKTLKQVKSNLK
tara:strand:- start:706 stop:879 length:174 start_codon:yes stop_codon:yes gene_type:complete